MGDTTTAVIYVLQCVLSVIWIYFCTMGWMRLKELASFELPVTVTQTTPPFKPSIAITSSNAYNSNNNGGSNDNAYYNGNGAAAAWSQQQSQQQQRPPAYGSAASV